MAVNIQLEYSNFCLTAQAGTFGSINTSDATTRFRIKSSTGGLISDYTLSANIHPDNTVVGIEYCGPLNLSEMIDNITFFTVERVPDYDGSGQPLSSSSQCIIKRWEANVGFLSLDLKQQTVFYTTGNYSYDVTAAAVEHYHRTFAFSQSNGQSYLDMSSANNMKSGDTLFLGPSSDTDNPGATEKVTVSSVDGDRVYLNSPNYYQYVQGDSITFFNYIYLISKYGYAGDVTQGTIFKHDVYSENREEFTTGGEYSNISGAKWNTQVASVAGINSGQLLFIRPYDSYLKWKSMYLTNIKSNNYTSFDVYDIVFDSEASVMYKLMKFATTKDDVGNKSTEAWSTYNYQEDTLLPYTHNVAIYTNRQYLIGLDETEIHLQTRDQFGVTLRDVNINIYDDGSDGGAQFDPINGQGVTDSNGKVTIGYISGGLYTGPTTISVKADKSSEYTGSEYCWNSLLIDNKVEFEISVGDESGFMFQVGNTISELTPEYGWSSLNSVGMRQIPDPFKVLVHAREDGTSVSSDVPPAYLICYSHFGQPGGNWHDPSSNSGDVGVCWPWFQITPDREDGPVDDVVNNSCDWDCITYPPTTAEEAELPTCPKDSISPRNNYITQVLEFTQKGISPKYYLSDTEDPDNELDEEARPLRLPQVEWFWQYNKDMNCEATKCKLEEGKPVPTKLFQISDSQHWVRFSQLKMSKHSYWVDGIYSDELTTNVELNQFIFVEDAVPAFFSEKNPRETDIWIRMRPFAFSLNGDTLKFYVRETWSADDIHYDTGYYDVIEKYGWPPNNEYVQLEYFDAGGGVLGIEFTYNNPDIYHHNSIVYVHIEVYDTSAEPNRITTDYWFRIIPDYKSPYIFNEDPSREEEQVALDTKLYFEIMDDGEGVDIDTLEVYLNSRIVYHALWPYNPATIIEEIDLNHYKVTIDLPYDLQYGKDYSVGVRVKDVSESKNQLRDSYRFYTRHSEVPWFTAFDPKLCKRGMPRFRDVSFIVLGAGDGVDEQTISIQVHDRDVTKDSKITPIIYRIS